jgi:methionyl-tRNA formyltransferase
LKQDFTIVYMGSPEFAVGPLEKLYKAGYNIPLVVSQPDKPKGRKGILTPTAVKVWAEEQQIPVITPENVNEAEVVEQIRQCRPDLLVVTAFGQILRKPLLELAPHGAVNIHASLLPKYRGAAPIHFAIMQGEKLTGVTTMFMDEGLDTGDMILQAAVEIEENDNLQTLRDKLMILGNDLILETVDLIRENLEPREDQLDEESSYAHKILPKHEKIDFNRPALEVHNQIRALSPEIGAFAKYEEGGKNMKFWQTVLTDEGSSEAPGTLEKFDKKAVYISTADKLLKVLELQPAGKGRMRAVDWWRGQQKNYTDKKLKFE